MIRSGSAAVAIFLATMSVALADGSIEQVQRALKEQGFYYGEITGKVDADTTAAIRRFQIRNGLKVTGDLDAETRSSLGSSASVANAQSSVAPTAAPRITAAPDTSDLHDDRTAHVEAPPVTPVATPPDYAPPPTVRQPPTVGAFDGTPYETAPPEVQQRIVLGAQTILARGGYYRSGIDGVFGSGTAAAVRTYQASVGLEPTGRLDMDTLAALGLLREQNRAGFQPRRRFFRPAPAEFTPDGEPIYIPR